MLTFFLGLSRPLKRSVSVLIDAMLLTVAFWGGYWVRLDMAIPIRSLHYWELLALLIPVTVFIFAKLGLYRAVLRYVGFKVLWTVSLGIFLSTLCLVTFSFFFEIFLPRTVSVIYFSFAVLLIGGVRLFFRMLVNRGKGSRVPVLIYGAGSSGRQLQLMYRTLSVESL